MTMDILSQARLIRVDPEAQDSLDKTAREYFEERSEQSAPDSVKDAFATLLDTVSARSGSQEDDWTVLVSVIQTFLGVSMASPTLVPRSGPNHSQAHYDIPLL